MSYLRKSLLVIFIILNLIWLAFSQLHVFNPLKIQEPHQLNFNALLSHVHWSEYDNQGIISHQFYAPLVKNISNHLSIIYSPDLRLQNDKEIWQIKAKFAKTKEGLDTIELSKNVKIKHVDDKSKQPSYLLTETLTYHPKSQEAHTKAPVTFNQGNNIIHSQGMDANFSNSTHIKLGQVNGVYHPENSNTTG